MCRVYILSPHLYVVYIYIPVCGPRGVVDQDLYRKKIEAPCITVDVNSLALPGQPAAAGDSIYTRPGAGGEIANSATCRRFIRPPYSSTMIRFDDMWKRSRAGWREDDEQEGARVDARGFSSLLAAPAYSTTTHRPYLIQERLITC